MSSPRAKNFAVASAAEPIVEQVAAATEPREPVAENPTPLAAIDEHPRQAKAPLTSLESTSFDGKSEIANGASRSFRLATKTRIENAVRLESSICAFWLGADCFGLDVALVGEVVNVESVLPVPLAPAPLLGLFNLRGTAVALVNLVSVLRLATTQVDAHDADKPRSALVLRSGGLVAAALIDRMEAVISRDRGSFTRSSEGDSSVVKGFIEVIGRPGLIVTLLDSQSVLESLKRLRYG